MSDGSMTPSQFQILREDIAAVRADFTSRFEMLVTRDTFRDERVRVDGRFKDQAEDITELKAAIQAEAGARVSAQTESLNAIIREGNEREKVRRQTAWQWVVLAITIVVGPIVGALVGSGMTLAGLQP